jgi:hypothetical protein
MSTEKTTVISNMKHNNLHFYASEGITTSKQLLIFIVQEKVINPMSTMSMPARLLTLC